MPDVDERVDIASRSDVECFVRDFYRQAAMDDLLGDVFARAHVDWSVHLPKLVDFWCWQLFGERGYEGNPLTAHRPVHERTPFTPAHYTRWLELFVDTIDESYRGPTAEAVKTRAAKMAHALERLMNGVHGDAGEPIDVMRPLQG